MFPKKNVLCLIRRTYEECSLVNKKNVLEDRLVGDQLLSHNTSDGEHGKAAVVKFLCLD
jgi:hypothetical protein